MRVAIPINIIATHFIYDFFNEMTISPLLLSYGELLLLLLLLLLLRSVGELLRDCGVDCF